MSKEQHQPGAADATENARHSVALRSAQLTMLQLRPRRHCRRWPPSKPCAEVADPLAAALREAVALPPGLDATYRSTDVKRCTGGTRGDLRLK